MSLCAAALYYARRGWSVFPLAAGTKVPIAGSRGLLDATTDAERIRGWWRTNPDANVGINCGASGLIVVDVDPRHGGDATWHELSRRHGDEESLTCITPSGGQHYYFQAGDHRVASGTNVLGPGVDVRAQGGYVVAPPSRLEHGGTYIWEIEHGPREIEPQPVPQWVVSAIATGRTRPAAASTLTEQLLPGDRRDRLFRLGAMLRDKGANEHEIAALLHAVNEGRCQPPLAGPEVTALARDIARRYSPKRNIFAQGAD